MLGAAKIIADDRTNSLLIFANDQDMVMIKTIGHDYFDVFNLKLLAGRVFNREQETAPSFLLGPATARRRDSEPSSRQRTA